MNTRIRELFIKVLNESDNMRWNIEDAEKFAELIIKEVCNTVLHYSSVDEGVAVVKRNFGIEE